MPPDPWHIPERDALRGLTRSFTEREIVPFLAEWEKVGEVPRSLHIAAAEAGLLGLGFPEAVGGSGGDQIDVAVMTEAMIGSGASTGLIAALFTHGIAVPHIVSNGDPHLIDRYVRPTLAGEMVGALAVTEPDGGSDVAAVRTRAERHGDSYRVNGAKTFITSGARADFVTTVVRTGGAGHAGLSLLVVDTDRPGFQVVRRLEKMGWRCSDTAELGYVDVSVPAGNRIGEPGSGFVQVARQFVGERLALATQAHATAQRCVDLTVGWARERQVFGGALIRKQAVRHRLVDMARRTAAAATYTRWVLERHVEGAASFVEAAMAKNTAVEACDFVVASAVQLHGGAGYMADMEVERHYRDAKILGIGGGATEVMNDLIAKGLGW
ncbi:MAG TPA: acyl-CoA dehydrogenase family protein [Mycobacteriales bacterium]|nr:acyl-CoA dehydrogenase family protein [Mycobacteriales bacterium]